MMRAQRSAALMLAGLLCGSASLAAPADFGGFWKPDPVVTQLHTTTGAAPPLTAAAQALYAQRQAEAKSGDQSFDNELMCRPGGIPRLLTQSAFELVVTEQTLVFLFDWNRVQRVVDVRPEHSEFDHAYPYYLGHPIASWQGGALSIDSIYFNDDTLLDGTGLPHSDALHVVEHLTLAGANTLLDRVRIEDPKSYTQPWEAELRFTRLPADTHFDEDVCVERLGLKTLNTHKNHVPGQH